MSKISINDKKEMELAKIILSGKISNKNILNKFLKLESVNHHHEAAKQLILDDVPDFVLGIVNRHNK